MMKMGLSLTRHLDDMVSQGHTVRMLHEVLVSSKPHAITIPGFVTHTDDEVLHVVSINGIGHWFMESWITVDDGTNRIEATWEPINDKPTRRLLSALFLG